MQKEYLYEIYLPLTSNDGRDIEHIKFKKTKDDLVRKFGGLTSAPTDKNLASEGIWTNEGTTYVDVIVTMKVITDKNEDGYFRDFKEVLKKRFHQEEILITKSTIGRI